MTDSDKTGVVLILLLPHYKVWVCTLHTQCQHEITWPMQSESFRIHRTTVGHTLARASILIPGNETRLILTPTSLVSLCRPSISSYLNLWLISTSGSSSQSTDLRNSGSHSFLQSLTELLGGLIRGGGFQLWKLVRKFLLHSNELQLQRKLSFWDPQWIRFLSVVGRLSRISTTLGASPYHAPSWPLFWKAYQYNCKANGNLYVWYQ